MKKNNYVYLCYVCATPLNYTLIEKAPNKKKCQYCNQRDAYIVTKNYDDVEEESDKETT